MVTSKQAFAIRPKGLSYRKRLPSDVGWQKVKQRPVDLSMLMDLPK